MQDSRGFTLIEVLVALLVLGIGVLGSLAFQARAQQHLLDAQWRDSATLLASDLLELMRSNPAGIDGYFKAHGEAFPGATGNCAERDRRAGGVAVARADLGCWRQSIERLLPVDAELLGRVEICRSAAPGQCSATGSAVLVRLFWSDRRSGLCEQEVCSHALRAEL
ncbi:type IV pilus modification protein PilV [Pseudomonas sp. QL9]|uniref:type IV pilus modification protein PilV n=1 Tax=Pseudomonas TaxID=286 RepID=UPI00352A3936